MIPPNSLPAVTGLLLTHAIGSLFPFEGKMDRFSLPNAAAEVRFQYESYGTENVESLTRKARAVVTLALKRGVALFKENATCDDVARFMQERLMCAFGDFPGLKAVALTLRDRAETIYVTWKVATSDAF